jgi:hypothetical protein
MNENALVKLFDLFKAKENEFYELVKAEAGILDWDYVGNQIKFECHMKTISAWDDYLLPLRCRRLDCSSIPSQEEGKVKIPDPSWAGSFFRWPLVPKFLEKGIGTKGDCTIAYVEIPQDLAEKALHLGFLPSTDQGRVDFP